MSTSSGETIAVSDSQNLLTINMTNVTKLIGTNFLMWSRQVYALLDGYDLTGYLDNTVEVPPLTRTVAGVTSDNPDYKIWKRQDRLIYSALLGAITVSVQPLPSTTTTSAEIWSTLSSIYAAPSRAHVQQLKQQIQIWVKGEKLIEEYFQGLTTRFDKLAHLGKPMELDDQIEKILKGLPDEYRRVIDQLEGRERTPSLPEVFEKLLHHEVTLKNMVVGSSSLPATANAVHVRGHRGQSRSHNRNHQPWQSQQSFQPRHHNSAPRGYQGRCQICGVHGHSARLCSQLQLSGSHYNTVSPNTPSPVSWQPRANLAEANPWILDSSATHHLTTDLSNLSLHRPMGVKRSPSLTVPDFLSRIWVPHISLLPLNL
ncbi:PREDICTED: uncharacterized protein LOC104768061 [Camelina sativa]|uniref:Uncharacterized protein LOC104768061 n=1 Tax=Camelina sativa TaxID=90675 RepID=A0ABM0XSD1_CAMSA|nr:PREDICTED: uncharacterized protein LOC104768061 [Camelina sativa]